MRFHSPIRIIRFDIGKRKKNEIKLNKFSRKFFLEDSATDGLIISVKVAKNVAYNGELFELILS